jgi:uncharacterized pyridoxal phosphate-containing UPF0001 family protein
MTSPVAEGRRAELSANLAAVRARIAAACAAAGRDPAEVTLIAVTKTWPLSDVRHLVELGVRDVGENRDAEAREKAQEAAASGVTGIRWHFIGQVQSNKARSIARYADAVHSVDRLRLVTALSTGAVEAGRTVDALLQVDLDPAGGDVGRGGVAPGGVPELADAPLGRDPAPAFATLAEVAARLRSDHPDAVWISAGMSGDLEVAVGAGATHVRVGSGLLGNRALAHYLS